MLSASEIQYLEAQHKELVNAVQHMRYYQHSYYINRVGNDKPNMLRWQKTVDDLLAKIAADKKSKQANIF